MSDMSTYTEDFQTIIKDLFKWNIKVANQTILQRLWNLFLIEGLSSNVVKLIPQAVSLTHQKTLSQYLSEKESFLKKAKRIADLLNKHLLDKTSASQLIISLIQQDAKTYQAILDKHGFVNNQQISQLRYILSQMVSSRIQNKSPKQICDIILQNIQIQGSSKISSRSQHNSFAFPFTQSIIYEKKEKIKQEDYNFIDLIDKEENIPQIPQIDYFTQNIDDSSKNIMIILVSNKKISHMKTLLSHQHMKKSSPAYQPIHQQTIKINYNYFFIEKVHYYFYRLTINFKNFPLEKYSVSIQFIKPGILNFLVKPQIKIIPLKDTQINWIQFKGLIWIDYNEGISSVRRLAILQSAFYLSQNLEKDWNLMRPWWKLIKDQYLKIKEKQQMDIFSISNLLIINKKSHQEVKYFIWLLKGIFKQQVIQIFSKYFADKLEIPSCDYYLQEQYWKKLAKENFLLQKTYVLCLNHCQMSKFQNHRQNILKVNLKYQCQAVQRSIALNINHKTFQLFEDILTNFLITSSAITVMEFIDKYFSLISHKIDTLPNSLWRNNQDNISNRLLDCMKLLLKKCKQFYQIYPNRKQGKIIFTKQVTTIVNDLFFSTTNSIQALSTNDKIQKIPKFLPNLAGLLQIIKQIYLYSRKLSLCLFQILIISPQKFEKYLSKNFADCLNIFSENPISQQFEYNKMFDEYIQQSGQQQIWEILQKSEYTMTENIVNYLIKKGNFFKKQKSLHTRITRLKDILKNKINRNDCIDKYKKLLIQFESQMAIFSNKIDLFIVITAKQKFKGLKNLQRIINFAKVYKEGIYFGHYLILNSYSAQNLTTHNNILTDSQAQLSLQKGILFTSNNVGLLWYDVEDFDETNAPNIISLNSLHFLSQDIRLEQGKYRQWLKLFFQKVFKLQNKANIIDQFKIFISKNSEEKLGFKINNKFYYCLLKLLYFYFNDSPQQLIFLIEGQQLWSKINFQLIKNYLLPEQLHQQQIIQQKNLLKLAYINFLKSQINGNESITINRISNLLKLNLQFSKKYNFDLNIKEIIIYTIKQNRPKIFADSDKEQLLTDHLFNSKSFGGFEFFSIKIFYYPDEILQTLDNVSKLLLFMQQTSQKSKNQDIMQIFGLKIQLQKQLIEKNLKLIMFSSKNRNKISNSYFQNKENLILTDEQFNKFYLYFKNIHSVQICQIIQKVLEEQIVNKLSVGLKNNNNFKSTLKNILRPPQREYEIVIINNFVKTSPINGEMFLLFLELIMEQTEDDKTSIQEILLKLIKQNPFQVPLDQQKILKQISSILQRQKVNIFVQSFRNILKLMRIRPEKFVSYLKGSLWLKDPMIKQLYLIKLCEDIWITNKQKKAHQQQLFDYLSQCLNRSKLNQIEQYQLKKKVINIYRNISSPNENQIFIEQLIWKSLQTGNFISFYTIKYEKQFQSILNKIVFRIKSHSYIKEELFSIIKNKQTIQKNIVNKTFINAAEEQAQFLKKILFDFNNLVTVFSNLQNLSSEYILIKQANDQIEEIKMSQICKSIKKYERILNVSQQMTILMGLNIWLKEDIIDYNSLFNAYEQSMHDLNGIIDHMDHLSYTDFRKYILPLHETSLHILLKNNPIRSNVIDQLTHLKLILSDNRLILIKIHISSILYLREKLKMEDIVLDNTIMEKFAQILQSIEGTNYSTINLHDLKGLTFKITKYISDTHGNDWQSEISGKIIRSIFINQQFFNQIQSKEVDRKKINGLRQYSNNLQNCIIRGDIIREFRNVAQLWNQIKSSRNIKMLIKKINQVMSKEEMTNIQRQIENCQKCHKMLFQKLQESLDLSLSFKYDVKAILHKSTVQLINTQSGVDLIIKISDKKQLINFKTLRLHKQKSMLVNISQISQQLKDQQNDQKQMFKQFIDLFEYLVSIKQKCELLVSYGYDSKMIKYQPKIANSSLEQVSMVENKLTILQRNWIKFIKNIYQSSYLLTHFIGGKLVQFVQSIIAHKYYPSLKYIMNTDEEQLKKQLDNEENRQLMNCIQTGDLMYKIQWIQQLFNKLDFNIRQQNIIAHKIILITSIPYNFYGNIILENKGNIPNANQVLFCTENTPIQQIQFFICRLLIDNAKIYFIVGIHRLQESVKSFFCTYLTQIKNKKNDKHNIQNSHLVMIDNDQTNSVFKFLCKSYHFQIQIKNNESASKKEIEKANQELVDKIPKTIIVSSIKAGLGKTYTVEQQAKTISNQTGKYIKVHHFSLGGYINFSSLGRRLRNLTFNSNEILLIKIGSVQNFKDLQIFLASISLFRCFYSEEYIYIPPTTTVYIELQNVFHPNGDQDINQHLQIIHILRRYKKQIRLEMFQPEKIDFQAISKEDEFVYQYLNILDLKMISHTVLKYDQKNQPIKKVRKIELIKRYYVNAVKGKQPTFLLYRNIMKMMFFLIQTLSKSEYLQPFILNDPENGANLESYRQQFLTICINNTINLLQQTFTQNIFNERAKANRSFRDMVSNIQMLIMPDFSRSCFKFVYLTDKSVPFPIKAFNLSQIIQASRLLYGNYDEGRVNQLFRRYSLTSMPQQNLIDILKCFSAKGDGQEYLQDKNSTTFKDYVLTLDNFFKMCLIIQRSRCGISCIIEGESGVGKTFLIQYLVQYILQQILYVCNIHAGVHEQQLIHMMKPIIDQADRNKDINYWVFFDEFNTCDELTYIKEMVIEHRLMGQKLSQNIKFIVACNPYRKKKINIQSKVGLKINRVMGQNKQDQKLAFLVHPPPLSMIQMMWDYQQLTEQQNQRYILKMLEKIKYKNGELVKLLTKLHEKIKSQLQISSVSLRDIERFKRLYHWFSEYCLNQDEHMNEAENSKISLALSLLFCYCLRFEDSQVRYNLIKWIQNEIKWKGNSIENILRQYQDKFIKKLKLPTLGVALNRALKQNVFTAFVCIMNKIPIIIIGNPGSSKSLSVHILASNFTGSGSEVQIASRYPEINMIYFQGSQSSSSAGIEEVFERADQSVSENYEYLNCIYFDEIGLAEKSSHNPLKVLHSKLQMNKQKISFIGISNWELDTAKMSRFLIVARSSPDNQDLRETACALSEEYLGKNSPMTKDIKDMGTYYFQFISQWERQFSQQNINSEKSGFFGLRDFYNYVKFVCKKVKDNPNGIIIKDLIDLAIQINFDGQPRSCQIFREIMNKKIVKPIKKVMTHLELIEENLKDTNFRCLLLIVQGDALVPIISSTIHNARVETIYGSGFSLDQQSEQYNLQITSRVIAHMSKGEIVAFKDINNSIQSSLYDLFNKAYTVMGNKKYCRIAVGANSNPKCLVHQNFNAIVFIEQDKIGQLDPPFLNRFEKHYLNLNSILSKQQENIKTQLVNWISQIIGTNRLQDQYLKRENYLMNSSEQSLITLIVKWRKLKSQSKLALKNAIKKQILQNRTFDLILPYLQCSEEKRIFYEELNQLTDANSLQNCEQDLIIYTYDQLIHLQKSRGYQKGYKICISQINSEGQLEQELKKGLQNPECNCVVIIINYSRDKSLIQQILFLGKRAKAVLSINRQIIVVIQIHRFSFMKSNDEKNQGIKISYLHQYQQFFKEDFYYDMQKAVCAKRYIQIYSQLNLEQKTQTLFGEAISRIKFIMEDQKKEGTQFFRTIAALLQNHNFKLTLQQFIQNSLGGIKTNFSKLNTNRVDVQIASNFFEAIYNLITKITIKVILLFLKLLTTRHFYRLFNNQMIVQNSQNEKIIQFMRRSFEKQIESLLQNLSSNGEQQLDKITNQRQSNLITIPKNPCYFSTISQFFDKVEKKWISCNRSIFTNAMETQQSKYGSLALFQKVFEKYLQQSTVKYDLKNHEEQYFYLHDLIQYYLSSLQIEIQTQYVDEISFFLQNKVNSSVINKTFLIIADQNKDFMYFNVDMLVNIFHYHKDKKQLSYIIQTAQFSQNENLESSLKVISQNIMNLVLRLASLEEENLVAFGGSTDLCKYAKETNGLINRHQSILKRYQIKIKQSYFLTNDFIYLMQSEVYQQKQKMINQFILSKNSKQKSIFERVKSFIIKRLKNNEVNQQKYYKFLSYNFFQSWIINCEQRQYADQRNVCISTFAEWCNQQVEMANRSKLFFNSMFTKQMHLQQQFEPINIRDSLNKFDEEINQLINANNNWTIALTNYFFYKISERLHDDIQQKIIDRYYQSFKIFINQSMNENTLNLGILFKIAFLKKYLLLYLNQLRKGRGQILHKIDQLLSKQNILLKHLRLFLLKILTNNKTISQIKDKFFKIKTCEWINHEQKLVKEKQTFKYVKFLVSQKYEVINQLKKDNYAGDRCESSFNEIIQQGLKNERTKYELLTVFLTHIYFNTNQNERKNLTKLIKHNKLLSYDQNKLLRILLLAYSKGSILKNNERLNQQQKYFSQVHLLNYLNIIISHQFKQNAFMEMFFERGRLPQYYDEWLSQRFLIGNIQHPAVSKIQFFLRRQSNNHTPSSYLRCSPNCQHIVPVGGTFYAGGQGCKNPTSLHNCPFCRRTIGLGPGGYGKICQNNQSIEPSNISIWKSQYQLRKKARLSINQSIQQIKLTGIGKKIQNWKQYEQAKRQSLLLSTEGLQYPKSLISHYILQTSIYFVWLFLIQNQLISQADIKNCFKGNKNQTKDKLSQIIDFYQNRIKDQLQLSDQQKYCSWSVGVGKVLWKTLSQCKSAKSLLNSFERDLFETKFEEEVRSLCLNQMERQKQSVANIQLAQINPSEVLYERVQSQQFKNKYIWLSLFKNLKLPQFKNNYLDTIYSHFIENYGALIQKENPYLHYLIFNTDQKVERDPFSLYNIVFVFTFLSKIKKSFNLKLRKSEKHRMILEQALTKLHPKQSHYIQQQLGYYLQNWQNLKDKFQQLQYDCTKLPLFSLEEERPINNFILNDGKQNNNVAGSALTSLIEILAIKYNNICQTFSAVAKKVNARITIIDEQTKRIDPTNIGPNSNLFKLIDRDELKRIIAKYSYLSVEQGNPRIQFSIQYIQDVLLKNQQFIPLLFQENDYFSHIKYVGENSHFLNDMKDESINQSLSVIHKKEEIDQYFLTKRNQQLETFHKIVKQIQASMEIILVYCKNIQFCAKDTLEYIIKHCKISNIFRGFQNQPFKSLPRSVFVDFYEYIQFITFQNIIDYLEADYKIQINKQYKQKFTQAVAKMKEKVVQKGYPTYQQFKNAVYRFAGRKVITEKINNSLLLGDFLIEQSLYWDSQKTILQMSDAVKSVLNIKIQHLGYILSQIPYHQNSQSKNQKMYLPRKKGKSVHQRVST